MMSKRTRREREYMKQRENIISAARENLEGRQLICNYGALGTRENPQLISTPYCVKIRNKYYHIEYVFYPKGESLKNGLRITIRDQVFVVENCFNDYQVEMVSESACCIVNVIKLLQTA